MRFRILFIVLLVVLFVLARCAKKSKDDGILVVTTFLPVYDFAVHITEDIPGITVKSIMDGAGVKPHHYDLKTSDIELLKKADVIVRHGLIIDSFLDEYFTEKNPVEEETRLITLCDGIPKRYLAHNLNQPSIGEETIEYGSALWDSLNPYLYLSPGFAAREVKHLTIQLAKRFPEHKDSLMVKGKRYSRELTAFSEELSKITKDLQNNRIIIQHNAWRWMARDTHLNVLGSAEKVAGVLPGPRETEALFDLAKRKPPSAIFADPNSGSLVIMALSNEFKMAVWPLDPMHFGKYEPGVYMKKMRSNLESIKEAFSITQ